jgi:xylan 1,4-beta-xylosidase
MFSKMRGDRLQVDSNHAVQLDEIMRRGVRDKQDVAALAARDGNRVAVMVWHYHDDDVPGPPADVTLTLDKLALPSGAKDLALQHFRIDDEHSNAFTKWKRMGSPQEPTAEHYKELESAGRLTELKDSVSGISVVNDATAIRFLLPRQAVSLLVFEAK